jgi:hypothetical protein
MDLCYVAYPVGSTMESMESAHQNQRNIGIVTLYKAIMTSLLNMTNFGVI